MVIETPLQVIRQVCITADGSLALTTHFNGTARVWDVLSGECLHTLNDVYAARIAPRGDFVITASFQSENRLVDARTGEELKRLEDVQGPVECLELSLDGRTAFAGCWNCVAWAWDTRTGKVLRTFWGHADRVVALALGRDGRTLVTASWDTTARVGTREPGRGWWS